MAGGYFSADRREINLQGAKMAEYRKGYDQGQKEPSETKAGEEKGQLSAKEHFGGGGMGKDGKKSARKHSRKSSRK